MITKLCQADEMVWWSQTLCSWR